MRERGTAMYTERDARRTDDRQAGDGGDAVAVIDRKPLEVQHDRHLPDLVADRAAASRSY